VTPPSLPCWRAKPVMLDSGRDSVKGVIPLQGRRAGGAIVGRFAANRQRRRRTLDCPAAAGGGVPGPFDDPRSILITGASSGIGAALARLYAGPGVRLALVARHAGRLGEIAEACRAAGAEVRAATLDVTERQALARWIAEADAAAPLDLVIANAGISGGTGGGGEAEEQVRQIFAINLDGVLNTVQPVVAAMRRRRRGQIAILSSLAGFIGFPGAPAYCASKAAVRVWGEALRGHLAAEGIGVSVICPGFIRTPMTAVNPYPMPFLMDADAAAHAIRRGLARNQARIAFPWPLAVAVRLLGALPASVSDRALRGLPEKPSASRG